MKLFSFNFFRLFRTTNLLILYIEGFIMSKEEEKERIHKEVVEWIDDNNAHFKENCKELYDKDNLDRIKRFAGAPIEYIDERLEANKGVSKSYHKFHLSILLAGLTAFYAVLLTQIIMSLLYAPAITLQFIKEFIVLVVLIVSALVLPRFRIAYRLMKLVGLLRVIRDSEIEVYYLTKIKEYRKPKKA